MSEILFDDIDRSAFISACKRYRYSLTRDWGMTVSSRRRMLFIMLNPSTADHEVDDPTIRRCIGFAKREDCASVQVVNLYAIRATNPNELLDMSFDAAHGGRVQTESVLQALNCADLVVCAWGTHKAAFEGWETLRDTMRDHAPLRPMFHLGLTKAGMPKHPLYLAKDTPLTHWNWSNE